MPWTLTSSDTTNLVTVTDPNGKQTLWSKNFAPDTNDDLVFVMADGIQKSVTIPYAATTYGTKAATIAALAALFSLPSGGGGGGNVAPSTVADSLLVGNGLGGWVESVLFKLQTIVAGVFGFVSVIGDLQTFFGRSGDATVVASRNMSTGALSDLELQEGATRLGATDTLGNISNLQITGSTGGYFETTNQSPAYPTAKFEVLVNLQDNSAFQTSFVQHPTKEFIITQIAYNHEAIDGAPEYDGRFILGTSSMADDILPAFQTTDAPNFGQALIVVPPNTPIYYASSLQDTGVGVLQFWVRVIIQGEYRTPQPLI